MRFVKRQSFNTLTAITLLNPQQRRIIEQMNINTIEGASRKVDKLYASDNEDQLEPYACVHEIDRDAR